MRYLSQMLDIFLFFLSYHYFDLSNLVPLPQVLTNKFESNLKIGARSLDRKLGHTLRLISSVPDRRKICLYM